ncbi:hypothetical protein LAD59_12495 [Klebsiella pneumoniae]|nr:hypothetical protein [Klebsiella pneumoniae]
MADLISWGPSGAHQTEKTESTVKWLSAPPCPVGFKTDDGNYGIAVDAIRASRASHNVPLPGQARQIRFTRPPAAIRWAFIIMRGGNGQTITCRGIRRQPARR